MTNTEQTAAAVYTDTSTGTRSTYSTIGECINALYRFGACGKSRVVLVREGYTNTELVQNRDGRWVVARMGDKVRS